MDPTEFALQAFFSRLALLTGWPTICSVSYEVVPQAAG